MPIKSNKEVRKFFIVGFTMKRKKEQNDLELRLIPIPSDLVLIVGGTPIYFYKETPKVSSTGDRYTWDSIHWRSNRVNLNLYI